MGCSIVSSKISKTEYRKTLQRAGTSFPKAVMFKYERILM
jgi:hypothetical protein